jgi:hypothetical protein
MFFCHYSIQQKFAESFFFCQSLAGFYCFFFPGLPKIDKSLELLTFLLEISRVSFRIAGVKPGFSDRTPD